MKWVKVQKHPSDLMRQQCHTKDKHVGQTVTLSSGKVDLQKPLHLVIGSVSPTSVILSWGTLLKTTYQGNIMNDCLEDGWAQLGPRFDFPMWKIKPMNGQLVIGVSAQVLSEREALFRCMDPGGRFWKAEKQMPEGKFIVS